MKCAIVHIISSLGDTLLLLTALVEKVRQSVACVRLSVCLSVRLSLCFIPL